MQSNETNQALLEAVARIDADLGLRVEAYLDSSVTAPTSRALITDLLAALIPEPHECEFECGSDLEHLQAAYDELKAEYADFRTAAKGGTR